MLYVFFFLFFMSGSDTLCHPLPQHNTMHARTCTCTLAALKCSMSFFFMFDGDTRATPSLNTTQCTLAPAYAHHPQMRYVCFFFLFFMSDGHPSLNTMTTHARTHARP